MGQKIIQQKNGKFAVFSTISDSYLAHNMNFNQLLSFFLISYLEKIERDVIFRTLRTLQYNVSEKELSEEDKRGSSDWSNIDFDWKPEDIDEWFSEKIMDMFREYYAMESEDITPDEAIENYGKRNLHEYTE